MRASVHDFLCGRVIPQELVLKIHDPFLQVYSWFLTTYNVSVFLGVAGYALLLMDILAAGQLSKSSSDAPLWLTLLWYGVYFGVLGRDCAEVAADRMVRDIAFLFLFIPWPVS